MRVAWRENSFSLQRFLRIPRDCRAAPAYTAEQR